MNEEGVGKIINGIRNPESLERNEYISELGVTSERELLSRIGSKRVDIADGRNPMLEINSQY